MQFPVLSPIGLLAMALPAASFVAVGVILFLVLRKAGLSKSAGPGPYDPERMSVGAGEIAAMFILFCFGGAAVFLYQNSWLVSPNQALSITLYGFAGGLLISFLMFCLGCRGTGGK